MRQLTRAEVLAHRVAAHQLDRDDTAFADAAILDLGAQDTGADGASWALHNRGLDVPLDDDRLVLLWTLRGAPHAYRRADLAAVAAAVAPFSEADAAKRIYDAAKPLKARGIDALTALDTVATEMHRIVARPTAKGDVSTALTAVLDPAYLRPCRACKTTHIHEMTFRLAAIRAGLELQPDTAPPVLQRIPKMPKPKEGTSIVETCLRLLGPATVKDIATFLEAPPQDVAARMPADAVEVDVDGQCRWLVGEPQEAQAVRLLGPYDLFLQADRTTLLPDTSLHKALWPVLGRPGAVLAGTELAGLWRPRASGAKLTVAVETWAPVTKPLRASIEEQAQRLAGHRQKTLAAVTFA